MSLVDPIVGALPSLPEVRGGGYSKEQIERMLIDYGRICVSFGRASAFGVQAAGVATKYWVDKSAGGFYLSKESVPESAWKRGGMVGLMEVPS